MGRWRTWIAVLVTAAGLGLLAPAPAGATTSCAVMWGSQDEAAGTLGSGPLTNVRGGRQACYDRLVLDLAPGSSSAGYAVGYVPFVGRGESGIPLPLRGGAFLEVTLKRPAYDPQTGAATYSPADPDELLSVAGWQTFRQVAFAGSVEGTSTIGLGVRARLPFRVLTLTGPGAGSRLVVDVAHRW